MTTIDHQIGGRHWIPDPNPDRRHISCGVEDLMNHSRMVDNTSSQQTWQLINYWFDRTDGMRQIRGERTMRNREEEAQLSPNTVD